jgi:hypothetical protein
LTSKESEGENVREAVTAAKKLSDEASALVQAAASDGVPLRLLGATAFVLRCPKYAHWHDSFERVLTDIDFVTYTKYRDKVDQILASRGYESPRLLTLWAPHDRFIVEHPEKKIHVDVFFDKLTMCHEIDFRGRLEKEDLTIPLADMFLEKMQIVRINEKDINDVIILLREHSLGNDAINIEYIAQLLSKDWGFFHTVEKNLGTVRDSLSRYDFLSKEDRLDIESKIDSIMKDLQDEPKTMKWRMRNKVGESKIWYNEVEEVQR